MIWFGIRNTDGWIPKHTLWPSKMESPPFSSMIFTLSLLECTCSFQYFPASDGKRITLERSQKHHFGTQPFWHSFGTLKTTSHQATANKTDIKFTDRRSTLEASRVPKRCLYQKMPQWEMQSLGWCHQVPRLPHKMNVDVTKCHLPLPHKLYVANPDSSNGSTF